MDSEEIKKFKNLLNSKLGLNIRDSKENSKFQKDKIDISKNDIIKVDENENKNKNKFCMEDNIELDDNYKICPNNLNKIRIKPKKEDNHIDNNFTYADCNESLNNFRLYNNENINSQDLAFENPLEKIPFNKTQSSIDNNTNNNRINVKNESEISSNEFCGITDETIIIWESILLDSSSNFTCHLIYDDNKILKQELDVNNQRVIKNDCDRTRVRESSLLIDFKINLELMLTFYCKINNFFYKQGLNEILAPFLLLKSCIPSLTYFKIFNLYSCFIAKFLPNYYFEKDFYSLQSSLSLLYCLLKYHNPMLYYILDYACISPEMFATSWILTMLSSKCSLPVVLSLFDIIIKENDEIFILYFIVAFLSKNQIKIIEKDYSYIPATLSVITISSIEEVHEIYIEAIKLKLSTPFSFKLYIDEIGILKRSINSTKRLDNHEKIVKLNSIPFFSSELIYFLFNDNISCVKSSCCNFIKGSKSNNFDMNVKQKHKDYTKCWYCIELRKRRDLFDEKNLKRENIENSDSYGYFNRYIYEFLNNETFDKENNNNKLVYLLKSKTELLRISNNLMLIDIRISAQNLKFNGILKNSILANQEDLNDEKVRFLNI